VAKTAGKETGVINETLEAGSCEGDANGGNGLFPPVDANVDHGESKFSGTVPVALRLKDGANGAASHT
jgi:hypothetical protein